MLLYQEEYCYGNFVKAFDVPFISNDKNPNDKCVPAVVAMVLGYLMPERQFTMQEVEYLCGYVPGKGTWKTQLLLSLNNLGFQTRWIEGFDHHKFADNPQGYLATILDREALDWQVKNSNLPLEAARIKQYLAKVLPLEHRKSTRQDIKDFLNDGWLVMVEVNGNTITGIPGYLGHVVLVIGYDEKNLPIHNPDSNKRNRPSQVITWDLFEKAWKEFGGSYSIYAFKLI